MMAGDDWGMMSGTGMGRFDGGAGSDGCPMMDGDEVHDWHDECEQIMEEECEEHMQYEHQDEEWYGEPEERGYGCPMMGDR